MITYPLSIPPGPPGPSRMRFGRMAAVAKTESPITFQQQIQDWQTRRWELEISWPPMTASQAAALQAFLDALGGQTGTFLAGDPLATTPRGSAKGSPICNGTANVSGSNQLVTAGWMPNQAGVLLPRDYLQVQATSQVVTGAQVTVADGIVTLIVSSGLSNPLSWIVVGARFNVAGTGIADGGPFSAASVTVGGIYVGVPPLQFQTGWLYTITYVDPAATPGSAVGGTLSQITPPFRLHRVMTQTPINTDGGGNATIDIFPPIRETLASGIPIVLVNTMGTFRMTENRVVDDMDSKKTITIGLKAVEAL